ncbi:hypothetical protein HK099_007704 [Clydaea vesicula]|uniref:Uncharacterized protein n=1 Tax=Clydaea vesicula TaxID=447962 RepID=A0AAD5TWJ0_9FUNG|nr:hypothetical protein HK099_007704 [Clydaea vesicula]
MALIWPTTPFYVEFRKSLLIYVIYLQFTQYLQYRYQVQRLYTLVAMNRAGPMETVQGDGVHADRLSFEFWILVPFLCAAQFCIKKIKKEKREFLLIILY